ncbi:hypothetical protein AVEN_253413-1 [Araneus ventricosus]|uniref:Uncharacterized protein n=1 Tax=Araneus ventricosus TaxID=182803 RepID=A0A4Y2K0K2_ARAVE|nr:hypothetical protein AVEN_253413-1 [Araneus ventricosus]
MQTKERKKFPSQCKYLISSSHSMKEVFAPAQKSNCNCVLAGIIRRTPSSVPGCFYETRSLTGHLVSESKECKLSLMNPGWKSDWNQDGFCCDGSMGGNARKKTEPTSKRWGTSRMRRQRKTADLSTPSPNAKSVPSKVSMFIGEIPSLKGVSFQETEKALINKDQYSTPYPHFLLQISG